MIYLLSYRVALDKLTIVSATKVNLIAACLTVSDDLIFIYLDH
jgi:hypothetical protein